MGKEKATMNDLNNLVGATILSVEGCSIGSDNVTFHTDKGDLRLYFDNDYYGPCCVDVRVEDVNGDLPDLVGGIVSVAEERSNQEGDRGDYRTKWTFYTIRTTKGDLDMRWLGKDNGYYGVSVHSDWNEKEPEVELEEWEKTWNEFMASEEAAGR
jgi:hypothetical protein